MSSQDTLAMAQAEEEKARVIQSQMNGNQADMDALQKSIQEKAAVNSGLDERFQEATKNAQNLRQKYLEEQQHEQQEQLKEQEKANEQTLAQKAGQGIVNNLF